jgi:hypothetical protein
MKVEDWVDKMFGPKPYPGTSPRIRPIQYYRDALIEATRLLQEHPISPEGRLLLALVDAEEAPDATPMQKWLQRKARFLKGAGR